MSYKWYGDLAVKIAYDAAMKELNRQAEKLLTESISQAPKDEGDLRRSGNVKMINGKIYVAYNTKYARRQHEELTWKHKDGKAKYLEDPFKARKKIIKKSVLAAVKTALKDVK
jgi:hypothetical protein